MDGSGKPSRQDSGPIVIIGGGIIACATAFYLCQHANTPPDQIHLVEASEEFFASASGKAGGFLASDWFDASTASLGALSFQLHKELSEEYNGRERWGYSPSTSTSMLTNSKPLKTKRRDWLQNGTSRVEVAAEHDLAARRVGPAWLTQRPGDRVEVISAGDTTAQVDPLRLCEFLLGEIRCKGVCIHHPARVVETDVNSASNMSVKIRNKNGSEKRIKCGRLLIAAGAWSGRVVEELFPTAQIKIPISHLPGYSVVVKSPRWARKHETEGCHAVFTTTRSGIAPEIFSRLGEEIYLAGLNDASLALPDLPTDAVLNPRRVEELRKVAVQYLGIDDHEESELQIIRSGLCFRPVTDHGKPILAEITEEFFNLQAFSVYPFRIFLAAGHGPWGISHSLGTGKLMAQMLEGRCLSADVSDLQL